MANELYEDTYQDRHSFSFGENWKKFLVRLNEHQIQEAMTSLESFLGGKEKIAGKTFVDIGCGSGLFSLAAFRLGAKQVVSVDIDESSVWCARELHKREGSPTNWQVITGSALDKTFLESLGTFDITYSWGVLHHTGDMKKALENILVLPHDTGSLYIALYNDNQHLLEGPSRFWHSVKKLYNKSPLWLQRVLETLYADYILLGLLLHGRNPLKYVQNYKTLRGMDFWTDIRDWLGGYPYEYARAEEIEKFFQEHGLRCAKIEKARSIGCNEFLFLKV